MHPTCGGGGDGGWRCADCYRAEQQQKTRSDAAPDAGFRLAVETLRARFADGGTLCAGGAMADDLDAGISELIKTMIEVIALASCGRVCSCQFCEASRAAFVRAVLAPN
jgi:hypothetical protein